MLIKEGILEDQPDNEKSQINYDEIKNLIDDIVIRFQGYEMVKTIPEVFKIFSGL